LLALSNQTVTYPMKYLLLTLSTCITTTSLGSAIPLSASRSSSASASVANGSSMDTQDDGPFSSFGSLFTAAQATRIVDETANNPIPQTSFILIGADTGQTSTFGPDGVSLQAGVGASIQRSNSQTDGNAGAVTDFEYKFELTEPHQFSLSINSSYLSSDPTGPISASGLVSFGGDSWTIDSDFSAKLTGTLLPGTYDLSGTISAFAFAGTGDEVDAFINLPLDIELRLASVIATVPDSGIALWPVAVLFPLLLKRTNGFRRC
jgi:hypothetical protein